MKTIHRLASKTLTLALQILIVLAVVVGGTALAGADKRHCAWNGTIYHWVNGYARGQQAVADFYCLPPAPVTPTPTPIQIVPPPAQKTPTKFAPPTAATPASQPAAPALPPAPYSPCDPCALAREGLDYLSRIADALEGIEAQLEAQP